VEARFVAVEQGQFRGGGQLAESAGDADHIVAGGLGGEAFGEQRVFDGPGAAQAPVRRGHLLDHSALDAIDGAEALPVRGEKGLKALAGLRGEDHAVGQEAVTDGVLGRTAFSLRGLRAAGTRAVGPGSENSSLGAHASHSIKRRS